jgi:hypothetical protein
MLGNGSDRLIIYLAIIACICSFNKIIIALYLVAGNYPGDRMRLAGSMTALTQAPGRAPARRNYFSLLS